MEDTIKKYGKSGYGWKVFLKTRDGGIRGEVFHMTEGPYKIGKRYMAILKRNFLRYTPGFHVFKTREGARNWKYAHLPGSMVVRKVKWSTPFASGGQKSIWNELNNKPLLDVIVAKHMTILPLKEKKK
jgi:hypothetical protein